MLLVVALFIGIACGVVGWQVMASKGRDPWIGGLLGLTLGPVGLFIAFCLPTTYHD